MRIGNHSRMMLARTVLGLAVSLGVTWSASAVTPSLTLTESQSLSDADLVRRVIEVAENSPAISNVRLPRAEDVARIVRPTGHGRLSLPSLPEAVIPGFHDTVLYLRGRETTAPGLCAFDEIDITFRPILPLGLKPGSKGWAWEVGGMTEAEYKMFGLKVPDGFKEEYRVPSDPKVEANNVVWRSHFAPVKRGQDCTKVDRSAVQTILARDGELVQLAMTLLPRAMRIPAKQQVLCVDEVVPESKAQCLTLFSKVKSRDISYVAPCLSEDGPNQRCISVFSRDFSSDMMIRRTWVAHIVYGPGNRPEVIQLRFEQGGGVL